MELGDILEKELLSLQDAPPATGTTEGPSEDRMPAAREESSMKSMPQLKLELELLLLLLLSLLLPVPLLLPLLLQLLLLLLLLLLMLLLLLIVLLLLLLLLLELDVERAAAPVENKDSVLLTAASLTANVFLPAVLNRLVVLCLGE